MKAEEQTPMEYKEEFDFLQDYLLEDLSDTSFAKMLKQYAELRIKQELQQEREKWKEEVIKAYHQGRIAQSLDTLNGNIVKSFDEIDEIESFKEGTDYYETQVKPRIETK